MPDFNPETVAALMIEASERFIMPRYQALRDDQVTTKTGPRDFVTLADIEAEAFLVEHLPQVIDGSIVIGEEGVSNGTASLDVLANGEGAIWVVDPVDGTYNFVHGKREFGIMVALVIDGVTEHAWIYDILGDDMAYAARGQGATISGKPLEAVSRSNAQEMHGFANPRYFPKEFQDHVRTVGKGFQSCRSLGCAAHEYLNIAKGEAQFSVYSRLKPWDHLPGALILQEAGGFIAKWNKTGYASHDDRVGLIAAADEGAWDIVSKAFLSGIDYKP